LTRVEITNYESIDHAVLEVNGFTSVVGPNYSGKSAAMRAINAALTNRQGTEFIRWGETFCEVKITSPGLELLWHKEEGNNFYVINGNTYKKIGRDDPPEELSKLGYGSIKLSGQKHNLHYAEQFSPLFLVDEENTKTADLVASVYGLDRLYKAAELCSKDQRANSSLMKIRAKDLENVREDLAKFEGLDDVVAESERLSSEHARIGDLERGIGEAKAFLQSMESMATVCNRIKPALQIGIPSSSDLLAAIEQCGKAKSLQLRLESTSSDVEALSSVSKIEVPSSDPLQDYLAAYQKALRLHTSYEMVSKEEEALRPVSGISVPDSGVEAIGGLLKQVTLLKSFHSTLLTGKESLGALTSAIAACDAELSEVDEQKSKFTHCPLCNQELKNA
jgi:DNA repair ATPase RecN